MKVQSKIVLCMSFYIICCSILQQIYDFALSHRILKKFI